MMIGMQENQFNKLIDAIGLSVNLSDAELKSLMWFAGRETQTVENVVSIFEEISVRNNTLVEK